MEHNRLSLNYLKVLEGFGSWQSVVRQMQIPKQIFVENDDKSHSREPTWGFNYWNDANGS